MTDNEPKGWEKAFEGVYIGSSREHIKAFIRDNFIPKAEVRKVVEDKFEEVSMKPHFPGGATEMAKRIRQELLAELLRALHISDE